MTINKKTLISSFWFALEVTGIFIVIHFIRAIIGNLDAIYIGLSLILIATLLFIIAFLIARFKDNQNPGKPGTKTFTRLSG
jgi:uncharacterized membrane protein YhaH (DUF805 family)